MIVLEHRSLSRSVAPSQRRYRRRFLSCALWVLTAGLAFVGPTAAGAFERVGSINLDSGQLRTAVIDPAGEFAYFGTFTFPGNVVKVDLATFERVGVITLEDGEDGLISAVIDPAGEFAYFGTNTVPARVVKIDLETFERAGAVTLASDEFQLHAAVIDPAGEFAYFGTFSGPGRVVKVDLADLERVGAITLESGENFPISAVIDPAGEFAYFGTGTSPGRVVKVDLAAFERVDAITVGSGEDRMLSALIDPAGEFAYFGTETVPGRVVKVDLASFERVEGLTLESGEGELSATVIDPEGEFGYFGTSSFPGRVVKIDLGGLERVSAITLESFENDLFAAVMDPVGEFAYFGTTAPGWLVKLRLRALTPVGLAVDREPFATLSDGNQVFEPGERVEGAPFWRNGGDTPLIVSGEASGFLGPAGATYDLVSPDADYGTVAPDATASCRDTGACYAFEVNDPMTRPALHWDATFDELLTDPSATPSANKTWTLHIGESFTDVPRTHLFYSWIETVLHHGVTSGCGGNTYCPLGTSTRGQMPAFVLRAFLGSEFTPEPCVAGQERFADVPADHLFCPWIEELADRGVVAGCGGDDYCPNDPVTRAQMAIFLLRTLEGPTYTPPTCSGIFADVPCPSIFADWVEELYNREITTGCTVEPLNYCPSGTNIRGQMAVFLGKAYGLALYGP